MYRVKNCTYRNTSETEGQHPNVTTDKFLSKKQINKTFLIERLTCKTLSFESLIMILLANAQLSCEELMGK